MKMLKYKELLNLINKNKDYVEKFSLEKKVGTKKMQKKFHMNAVIERNSFINSELNKLCDYQKQIYLLLKERVEELIPIDNNLQFNEEINRVDNYKDLIIYTGNMFSNNYKLKFEFLISKIDDINSISLKNINLILKEYIDKFKDMNIILTIEDFNYSMFVKIYMNEFFNNMRDNNFDQIMQKCFEKIYWECPNLITHLKLNLYDLLNKYEKQINIYTKKYINDILSNEQLANKDIIQIYRDKKFDLELRMEKDENINLNNFLNKKYSINDYLISSPTRDKNYNLLTINGNYNELIDDDKVNFNKEIFNLYHTLLELKEYYFFEIIIKDIVDKYKKKSESKTLFNQKLKEIGFDEKIRIKLCKDYNKSQGIGLFSKKDNDKAKILKLKMNEEITKLSILYKELHDLEINNKINDNLNDSSSIYSIAVTSFSSYYYLQNIMNSNYNHEEFNLDELMNRYFKFIYSPYNTFLKKSNGLIDYDITGIVADKYRLLGINITRDMVSLENIDSTIELVKFITLIISIGNGKLTLDEMNFICKFKSLKYNYEEVL